MKRLRRHLAHVQAESGLAGWVVRRLHLAPRPQPAVANRVLRLADLPQVPEPDWLHPAYRADSPQLVPAIRYCLRPGVELIARPLDAFGPPSLQHGQGITAAAGADIKHRPLSRAASAPMLRRQAEAPHPPLPPVMPQVVVDTQREIVVMDDFDRFVQRQAALNRLDGLAPTGFDPTDLGVPQPPFAARAKRSEPALRRRALAYASQMLARMAEQAPESEGASTESLPPFHLEDLAQFGRAY